MTFLDCEKYPPSLLYLLMTLGPAILLMPVLEKARGAVTNFFNVFGKVPMFYYLLHIYLIHALQLVSGLALGFPLSYFTSGSFGAGENWGFGLPVVYLVWLIVIGILYFPCRWFMQLKQRRKDAWLRYL